MWNELQEAVEYLGNQLELVRRYAEDYPDKDNYTALADIYTTALDTIVSAFLDALQRQPDPETGLLPCGCGGKAQIINSSGYSRRLYVECDRCDIMLGVEATGDGALQGIYRFDDQIIEDWNQAMGRRRKN